MTLIPAEVLFVNKEIMVCVKLPEATVEDVEVLVGEVMTNFVDVFLRCNLMHYREEVGVLEITERDMTIIICGKHVENAHHDSVCVALLELGRLLKEL